MKKETLKLGLTENNSGYGAKGSSKLGDTYKLIPCPLTKTSVFDLLMNTLRELICTIM